MTTAAQPVFGTDTLRRGVEADTPDMLKSLYADDAELRVV
ncbi:nuclear transport factor 2 family protein, partial [Streptomyces werraensis]